MVLIPSLILMCSLMIGTAGCVYKFELDHCITDASEVFLRELLNLLVPIFEALIGFSLNTLSSATRYHPDSKQPWTRAFRTEDTVHIATNLA